MAEEESVEAVAEDEAESEQPEEQLDVSDIPKPTTWKKDLLPLWDKIAKGEKCPYTLQSFCDLVDTDMGGIARIMEMISNEISHQKMRAKKT